MNHAKALMKWRLPENSRQKSAVLETPENSESRGIKNQFCRDLDVKLMPKAGKNKAGIESQLREVVGDVGFEPTAPTSLR